MFGLKSPTLNEPGKEDDAVRYETVNVGWFNTDVSILEELFEGGFDFLLINRHGRPYAAALARRELVIDTNSSELREVSKDQFKWQRASVLRAASNGEFTSVTRSNEPFVVFVPVNWLFDQIELIKAAQNQNRA